MYPYTLKNTKTVSLGFHGVLRNEVTWAVLPCGWVIWTWRFKETQHLHLQGCKSICCSEKSGRNYATTRPNNPEYLLS